MFLFCFFHVFLFRLFFFICLVALLFSFFLEAKEGEKKKEREKERKKEKNKIKGRRKIHKERRKGSKEKNQGK